jgi:hypothetical protein
MIGYKTKVSALVALGFVVTGAAVAIAEDCVEKHDLAAMAAIHNDYPTNTRGDYIYGCMLVNGMNREVLDKCACSIDVIATVLPYDKYEEAETIMAVVQRGGENVAYLRAPAMREKVHNLKRAQVEGELRCF